MPCLGTSPVLCTTAAEQISKRDQRVSAWFSPRVCLCNMRAEDATRQDYVVPKAAGVVRPSCGICRRRQHRRPQIEFRGQQERQTTATHRNAGATTAGRTRCRIKLQSTGHQKTNAAWLRPAVPGTMPMQIVSQSTFDVEVLWTTT